MDRLRRARLFDFGNIVRSHGINLQKYLPLVKRSFSFLFAEEPIELLVPVYEFNYFVVSFNRIEQHS